MTLQEAEAVRAARKAVDETLDAQRPEEEPSTQANVAILLRLDAGSGRHARAGRATRRSWCTVKRM